MSQLEAWEMVFVTDNFLNTSHGKIGCVSCHNGDPSAYDKEGAHKNVIAAPSDDAETFCAVCHSDITSNYSTSLHYNLTGYFKRIENRLGESIEEDQDKLDHFNKDCGKCHVSCGQCHVSRPISVKGGFVAGHTFGEPDWEDNCIACHGSRIGAEYNDPNISEGLVEDLHRFKRGGNSCKFYHDADEMHSSGQSFDYRYLNTDMPRCEDCHADKDTVNIYHKEHWSNTSAPQLSCQVCHSQPYKNCNGCHAGEGLTEPSYYKLKIAKNNFNLEAANRNYDYVTVRHIPVVPDTYKNWGIANLPKFDSEPTWKYTTPHNIQKWTAQTDTTGTNGKCGASCHESTEYYLTTKDLFDFEIEANKDIVLDDKLPVK